MQLRKSTFHQMQEITNNDTTELLSEYELGIKQQRIYIDL